MVGGPVNKGAKRTICDCEARVCTCMCVCKEGKSKKRSTELVWLDEIEWNETLLGLPLNCLDKDQFPVCGGFPHNENGPTGHRDLLVCLSRVVMLRMDNGVFLEHLGEGFGEGAAWEFGSFKGTNQKKKQNWKGDKEVRRRAISLLPGRGPSQQLEAWLRVSGEDNVPG